MPDLLFFMYMEIHHEDESKETANPQLRLEKGTLNLAAQLCRVEPVLIEDENAAITTKREVRTAIFDKNLAKQNTARRPNVDTIATSGIDIALSVDLDTVGDANTGHSKDTAVS
jgi:hypothetical protein